MSDGIEIDGLDITTHGERAYDLSLPKVAPAPPEAARLRPAGQLPARPASRLGS